MGQIYLVRHGQASFGSTNYDQLSPLGMEQARLLGKWFAQGNQQFNQIVTGTMQRHRQTADACFAALPRSGRGTSERDADAGFNEYNHHEVLVRHWPAFEDPGASKRFIVETENGKRAFQK